MNAEYLLDAIGQLDDELVREAERYRRPKARWGRLMGLAACFAVAVALGYVLTHFGMGGGAGPSYSAGGGNGGAPASGNSAPSAADGTDTPHEPEQPLGSASPGDGQAGAPSNSGDYGDASPDLRDKVLLITLRMDEPMNRLSYGFRHYYNEDKILNELPEGCVELGRLEALSVNEEPNVPYTDSEEYVGCPVWLLRTDPVQKKFKLYVELPEGGYLECH